MKRQAPMPAMPPGMISGDSPDPDPVVDETDGSTIDQNIVSVDPASGNEEPDFGDLQDDYRTLVATGRRVHRLRWTGYRGAVMFSVDGQWMGKKKLRALAAAVRAQAGEHARDR